MLNRRTFSGIIGLHAWSLSDSDFMRNHEGANLRLGDDAHPTPILDTVAFIEIHTHQVHLRPSSASPSPRWESAF